MPDAALMIALFAISALSLTIAVISLYVRVRPPEVTELHGEVRRLEHDVTQVRLDVTDILDKLDHLNRRIRIRQLREGKERVEESPVPPNGGLSTRDLKASLRERVGFFPATMRAGRGLAED